MRGAGRRVSGEPRGRRVQLPHSRVCPVAPVAGPDRRDAGCGRLRLGTRAALRPGRAFPLPRGREAAGVPGGRPLPVPLSGSGVSGWGGRLGGPPAALPRPGSPRAGQEGVKAAAAGRWV